MDLAIGHGLMAAAGRYVWHEASRTVVVADLHLGVERQLARAGMYVPDLMGGAGGWLERDWGVVVGRLAGGGGGGRLVIAGDLFDSAEVDEGAIGVARGLLAGVPAGCEVLVVPGNHDPGAGVLGEWLAGTGAKVVGSVEVGGYRVVHGHEELGGEERGAGAGWIVGHQHPAVVVGNRVRRVKMVCFAVCAMRGGRCLIVLPAFSRAALGSDLGVGRNWLLGIRRPGAGRIRIAGIVERAGEAGRVLDFGMLSDAL